MQFLAAAHQLHRRAAVRVVNEIGEHVVDQRVVLQLDGRALRVEELLDRLRLAGRQALRNLDPVRSGIDRDRPVVPVAVGQFVDGVIAEDDRHGLGAHVVEPGAHLELAVRHPVGHRDGVGERPLLHEPGVLVEVEPADHPRAGLIGLELDELPVLRAVDEAGRRNRPADAAQFEVEVVLLPVGVERGLVEPVRERREQRHAVVAGIGSERLERGRRADEVVPLHANPPGVAHVGNDLHVHLGRGVDELDDVALLYGGVTLGGRRGSRHQDEDCGQRKSQQFHRSLRWNTQHRGVPGRRRSSPGVTPRRAASFVLRSRCGTRCLPPVRQHRRPPAAAPPRRRPTRARAPRPSAGAGGTPPSGPWTP